MYSSVTIPSEPRIAIGSVRLGFLHSSAVVATMSKPMAPALPRGAAGQANASDQRCAARSRPSSRLYFSR